MVNYLNSCEGKKKNNKGKKKKKGKNKDTTKDEDEKDEVVKEFKQYFTEKHPYKNRRDVNKIKPKISEEWLEKYCCGAKGSNNTKPIYVIKNIKIIILKNKISIIKFTRALANCCKISAQKGQGRS